MGLFGKKKTENTCCGGGSIDRLLERNDQSEGCGCGGNCACNEDGMEKLQSESVNVAPVIKILGSGCKNCITLAENVNVALSEMKLDATIEKVTDFAEITGYGVMSTPALVVNEKVVSYGKVLKPQEVTKLLEKLFRLDN